MIMESKIRSGRGRRNRARPDLNLTEISERLEIHLSRLSRILSGETTPTLEEALKLAPVLGVSVEALPEELERYKKRIEDSQKSA